MARAATASEELLGERRTMACQPCTQQAGRQESLARWQGSPGGLQTPLQISPLKGVLCITHVAS